MVNLNDDPETAKVKDKDDHESTGNIPGSHKLIEGAIDDRVGKRHEETTNSVCEEKIHQIMNTEDNNEIGLEEENLETEKLEIIPEPVCEYLIEETNGKPEGINIHDSTDDVNPSKKEITEMVNPDDHKETAKVKDEDNKEKNRTDISGSHKLVEATIHYRVGKQYNETADCVCEEEVHLILTNEDNCEVGIQEEKNTQNLEIISEAVPEVYTEEINGESEEINIHYMTDDANPDKKIMEMVNLNDDMSTATVKDGDNQEKNMSDILDIYKSVEATTQEKIAKQHDETTSLVEEEIHQITNTQENKELEIQEVKMDTQNPEIISKTATEDHIKETKGKPEAIDIYDSTDDAYPDKKHLNDEPETAKINVEGNCEKNTSDVSYAQKLVKATIDDRISKKHDNTGNFLCEEEPSLNKNTGDNNDVDILEEKKVIENLEIIPKLVHEDREKEANVEPEAINIRNSTDDANSDKKIKQMVDLNNDTDDVKVKDEDNKENNTSGTFDAHKLVEDTIHERVGKQHDEIANSLCEENHKITNNEDKNEIDIKEDKIDIEMLAITSKPILDDQIKETNGESEAINIENSTDDANEDKKIIEAGSLIDDAETIKVKDEDNHENDISSDAHKLVDDITDDGIGKQHDETTNYLCEEEIHQITNTEDINKVDIQEERTDTKILSELVPVDQIEETNCEPEAIHILDSINNADAGKKKITKMVNLNDDAEIAKVKGDNMILDRVGKQHEETTNCEEEIHQITDIKDDVKVSMHKEDTDVKKFEVISDRLTEDHSKNMAYERETTKIETILGVGDYAYSIQTASVTTSKTLYEDKIHKEGPPDLASSELGENMDNQILEKDISSKTSELSCKENMVEKAYEFESPEKPKDTSMIESRDEERQRKEENSDKIIEKPSPTSTEAVEVSAQVVCKREITGEDSTTIVDDSVSTRCEMIEETFQKKEENQMTEEETPEIAYTGQNDETNEVNGTMSGTISIWDKVEESDFTTKSQNFETVEEMEDIKNKLSANDENKPTKFGTDEDGSYYKKNIDHLNEKNENSTDRNANRDQRPDDVTVATASKDKADLYKDQRISPNKSDDTVDKILNQENYDNVNTEDAKSINEESIERSFDNPPILPELVGELSDILEYNCNKTPDAPYEEQICDGVPGKIGIDRVTKVVEEDTTKGALSASQYSFEEMTNKRDFSAEGNDYIHEAREVTRNRDGTMLEKYEAKEAAPVSGKQSQATTADKLNLEFGLISEEKLKTFELEKNKESETTGKEEKLDACIGMSSYLTSEESSMVDELESPLKEIINAEAVKGIDEVFSVKGTNSISLENFETRAGTRSTEFENENERNCDPVDDSLYAKEASDNRKIQNKASDKELEGLVNDVVEKSDIVQREILERETSEQQDVCMNSETEELEEETQDKENQIQQEKKVSEEKISLETDKQEDVGLENHFNGILEVLQAEHSNHNGEILEKEERDDTLEERFQENENMEPEASKPVTVSDTSEDAISQELALKSMFACEKLENMDTINKENLEHVDAANENTSKKVDGLSATDNLGGETITGEASGFHLQMKKTELATITSEEKFQNIGTRDEETQEKNEELNLKLPKYAKEFIELDDPLRIVLEGVETAGLDEKTKKNIIAEGDAFEDPNACFKEETVHEQFQKDEIKAEKNNEPKTKQKTDMNDTMVKEFDCIPSEDNPLAGKSEIASQIDEQFQKGDVGAKNKIQEVELETTDIMAHECQNNEVIELVHMPSRHNPTLTSLNEKIETASLVNLESEENLDSGPGSGMKNTTTHEQLQKKKVKVEKNKEPQTKWEIERTDTIVNESSDDKVKEFDCIPAEEKSMTAVFAEKIETVLTLEVERFQKDDIEAEKNKEPETRRETETTNTMADDPPSDEVKEFHCSPSEDNSTMAVMKDKIEKVSLLKNKDGNKNLDVPLNSCVKDEIMHEKVQSDDSEIVKNKEPQNSHELETNDSTENEFLKDEVKDLVCMSSEEDSLWTVLSEKTEAALLMDELDHEKKNLDVGLAACIKDEIANEQFQNGKIEVEKAKEQHTESEPNKTDNMANENDKVAFDIIPSEENSIARILSEIIGNRLPISEEDEKKNFDGGPDSRVKDEIRHEQFKKDEFEAQKNKELQAKWETEETNITDNQLPNDEVKNLDCKSSELNSIMPFLTEKTETGILMDEDDEQNLSALSLVSTSEEQTMQEVGQENEVSYFTLSKSTQNEEMVVELTKVRSYGKGSAEVDKLETSNDSTSVNTNDIALNVNVRDEEVPESTLFAVVLSEDSRIETLNQDKEMTGEASNMVSKSDGDETNQFSVKATENEEKSNKLSSEQTVEVRSPTEGKRKQHTEEASDEVVDCSQDEEKHKDLGDLPVSHLLFENILRNIVDTNDQILDSVSKDNGSLIQNQVGNSASLPAEQVIEETSIPEERTEADKKFEDIYDLLQEESRDVKENITDAIIKKDETSQGFLHYSSPSLAKSKNIMDNEVILKHGGVSVFLPTEEVKEETRISEDKEGHKKLDKPSASVIEVKYDTMGNAENAVVKDGEKHNNLHSSPILEMGESVEYKISGLQYEESTFDVTNENKKMTSMEKNVSGSTVDSGHSNHPEQDQKSHATTVEKLAGDPEKLNKDLNVSSITEGSSDDVLQKESKEDGKVTLEELNRINNTFQATEEKILSVSEPIWHTTNILQGKETLPNFQYNQAEESYKSSVAESQKQEETVEIELQVKEKEIGDEIPDKITKQGKNVNKYSSEELEVSDLQKDEQSNLLQESTNGTVQITESSAISEDNEKQTKEAIRTQIEEEKTDEDRDEKEEEGEHIIEESGKDVPVNVEARDANSMQTHKKSHNILSGVGSKVKHSLAKVRKAIKGKSSHPKATSAK